MRQIFTALFINFFYYNHVTCILYTFCNHCTIRTNFYQNRNVNANLLFFDIRSVVRNWCVARMQTGSRGISFYARDHSRWCVYAFAVNYHCEIVRCSAVLAPLLRDRTSWRDAKHAIMRFHYYAAGMRHFSVRTRTVWTGDLFDDAFCHTYTGLHDAWSFQYELIIAITKLILHGKIQ